MSFLNHSLPLLPFPSNDACHWRMKEHCPVSPPPRRQGREGEKEEERRLVNYGAIWHRFGFQRLAGVAGRRAVEKTVVLRCMLMSDGVAHLRVIFAADYRSADDSLPLRDLVGYESGTSPGTATREAVCR